MVSTEATFKDLQGFLFFKKKSKKSPSSTAPKLIALAVSITEPPPKAKIKSTFSSLHSLMPS